MKPDDLRGLYEEISNSVTHAIALGLALGGSSILVSRSLQYDNVLMLVSAIVYSICLVLIFASSTLYHGYQLQPHKHYFRVFDHCTIYLMIAGSMTPFILPFIQDTMDVVRLGLVWGLSLLGVLYKVFLFERSEWESVGSYFVLTAVGFFAVVPMFDQIHFFGTLWLMSGLLIYISGVYFYVRDYRPFYHTVWHCFVVGGAAAHYFAIYFYVIAPPGG